MAKILDCETFENQLKLHLEYHPIGRPTILIEMEQLVFYDLINEYIQQHKYLTIKDAHQLIIENTEKIISINTVRQMFAKSDQFKVIRSIPMYETRVNVKRSEIDEF